MAHCLDNISLGALKMFTQCLQTRFNVNLSEEAVHKLKPISVT